MYISFDLEIFNEVVEGDWQAQRPLGISCAATQIANSSVPGEYAGEVWQAAAGAPASRELCCEIVGSLMTAVNNGYTIVTVNGMGFDFAVLAEESGMMAECADLALNHHCDMMLMSVVRYGWRVSLDSLARGARVPGKMKTVTLKDGSVLEGMGGAMAPRMWQAGERDAVVAYLKDDVRVTLDVAQTAVADGELRWHTQKGKPLSVVLRVGSDGRPFLPTVRQMLGRWDSGPRPDQSWMDSPMTPYDAAQWALDVIS